MLPSATVGFTPTPSVLFKGFENKKSQDFKIIEKDHTQAVITPIKKLRADELIARMAFRFFGLHNMSIYNADSSFLQNTGYAELPLKAEKLLHELKNNYAHAQQGKIYTNVVSKYKSDLTVGFADKNILSYSIVMDDKEILVAYNTSKSEAQEKFILLNQYPETEFRFLKTIYGYDPNSYIQVFNGIFNQISMSYIRLYLKPLQLIILKNF